MCVRVGDWAGKVAWTNRKPVLGEVLTIRSVYNHRGYIGVCFYEIKGLFNPDARHEQGFLIDRFRPLITQQDDVELFRHLLSPSPLERLDLLAERLNELAED